MKDPINGYIKPKKGKIMHLSFSGCYHCGCDIHNQEKAEEAMGHMLDDAEEKQAESEGYRRCKKCRCGEIYCVPDIICDSIQ
jgi:hypothetical protein